ncbi:MAG: DUF4230 domain-containing protein [Lentisphaeria bacterium]
MYRFLITLVLALAAAALLAGLGFWAGRTSRGGAPVYNSQVLLEQVRQVAKVATVEYTLSSILDVHDAMPWYLPDKRVLATATARLLAGFNVQAGLEVTVDGRPPHHVTVTLPEPEILAVDPVIRFYDLQGPKDAELYNALLLKARRDLRTAALQQGILDRAKTSMETQFQAIFHGTGITVTVRYRPRTAIPPPATTAVTPQAL